MSTDENESLPQDDPGREEPAQKESSQSANRMELDSIFQRLYKRLKPIAARVCWPSSNPTMNGTALLNEAYVKLLNSRNLSAKSDEELIRMFAHVMRQVLIDRIRKKLSEKGGGRAIHVPMSTRDSAVLDPASPEPPVALETLISLESALSALESCEPFQARVIDCRFYLGLTAEETALCLHVAKTKVEREHRRALDFLNAKLQPKG